MKATDCVKLEKDRSFKYEYLRSMAWWKNILLVPPTCFLFVGLVGILYLFNQDQLVSYYAIPYLICFMIGTIWLKAIKKHVQKTILDKEDSFLVCLAKVVGERDGYVYTLFVNKEKRHNEHYISTIAKEFSLDSVSKNELRASRKKAILLPNEEDRVYLKSYFNNNLNKRNAEWRNSESIPLLFIDEKHVEIIKKVQLP